MTIKIKMEAPSEEEMKKAGKKIPNEKTIIVDMNAEVKVLDESELRDMFLVLENYKGGFNRDLYKGYLYKFQEQNREELIKIASAWKVEELKNHYSYAMALFHAIFPN